jgi:Domain of Unknown Function with PDB structure (DUF3862)
MRRAKSLCFLLICCIAALSGGCSGNKSSGGSKVGQSNFDKIKEGMTEAEVKSILGPPSNETSASISRTDPKTGTTAQSNGQMSWGDGDRSITIDFTDGKVTGKKQQGL